MKSEKEQCDPAQLQDIAQRVGAREASALKEIDQLLKQYPTDFRLSFLRASVLGGLERFDEAIREFQETLSMNSEYELARFQLGLMLLTQKRITEAVEIWRQFNGSARDNSLAMFALGLQHLIAGRLGEARRILRAGVELNQTLPALSDDMQSIVDRIDTNAQRPSDMTGSDMGEHLLISEYVLGRYRSH